MEPLPTHPAPRGSSSTQGLGQAIIAPSHSKPLARLKTFKLHLKKTLKPPKLCAQGFYFTKKKKFCFLTLPSVPTNPLQRGKPPKTGKTFQKRIPGASQFPGPSQLQHNPLFLLVSN